MKYRLTAEDKRIRQAVREKARLKRIKNKRRWRLLNADKIAAYKQSPEFRLSRAIYQRGRHKKMSVSAKRQHNIHKMKWHNNQRDSLGMTYVKHLLRGWNAPEEVVTLKRLQVRLVRSVRAHQSALTQSD